MDIYEIINEAVKYDRTVTYSINADGFMIHGGVIDMSSCIEFDNVVGLCTEDEKHELTVDKRMQFNKYDIDCNVNMYTSGIISFILFD